MKRKRIADTGALLEAAVQGHSETPELDLASKIVIPGYQVEEVLGAGGMGRVYRGRQTSLNRIVAIKLLDPELATQRDFLERFQQEAEAMAKLQHSNIVTVFDFGVTDEGVPWLAMEWMEGGELSQQLRDGPIDPARALEVAEKLAAALACAHKLGVVHRDLKPANVLLDSNGEPKLADFGLAKLLLKPDSLRTQTGIAMGTADYVAPEQLNPDAPVDQRADLYSFAAMFYELLTGERPRGNWSPPSQCVSKLNAKWDRIVVQNLSAKPGDRMQDGAELHHSIKALRSSRRGVFPWVWASLGITAAAGAVYALTSNPSSDPPIQMATPDETMHLFSSNVYDDVLTWIDPKRGSATSIGALWRGRVSGLTYDSNRKRLLGIHGDSDGPEELLEIDPKTGSGNLLATVTGIDIQNNNFGAAFDPENDLVYLATAEDFLLFSIHPVTGEGKEIGPTTESGENRGLEGLAFAPETGTLFGVSARSDALFRVDTQTANLSKVGDGLKVGLRNCGLAYHPTLHQLFAIQSDGNRVFRINPETGVAKQFGDTKMPGCQGATFAPLENASPNQEP